MASLWLLVFLAAAVEGSSAFAIAGVMSPTACSSATCSCLLWPTPHFLRSAEPPSHRGAWHMTLDAGVDWSDKVVEAAKKKAVELVAPVIPYIQSTYIHSCIHACIHSQHFWTMWGAHWACARRRGERRLKRAYAQSNNQNSWWDLLIIPTTRPSAAARSHDLVLRTQIEPEGGFSRMFAAGPLLLRLFAHCLGRGVGLRKRRPCAISFCVRTHARAHRHKHVGILERTGHWRKSDNEKTCGEHNHAHIHVLSFSCRSSRRSQFEPGCALSRSSLLHSPSVRHSAWCQKSMRMKMRKHLPRMFSLIKNES